jgi:hypothetical protein
MSKRKPHNRHARIERSCRALLSSNHVAVVSIDPSGCQWMINWKSCKIIRSRGIVDAIFDVSHRWTIYLSALCVDQIGSEYIKSVEIETQGVYQVDSLAGVIEISYRSLLAECNQNHIVASGWIAIPCSVSLEEAQAARIFNTVDAWHQRKAA